MPNWCYNSLQISGKPDNLKKFVFDTLGLPAAYPPQEWEKDLEQKAPTQKFFCFNALVPTPQNVLDMGYDAHDKLPENIWDLIQNDQPIDNIDGYHWSIQNWGTKWDVYYNRITPEEMGWSEGCESIGFTFDTAWSPPRGWFAQVIQRYPELEFELHYEESGCFFAGNLHGENGVLLIDEFDEDRCRELFGDLFEDEEGDEDNDSPDAGR